MVQLIYIRKETQRMQISPVRLEVFRHLFASVAEEMGVILGRSSYSANIKERKDFSCAIFNGSGEIIAQAAHIPVHLGSMPLSVQAAINKIALFEPGDLILVNDPYSGGTHLPDITLIEPVFVQDRLAFFVANRAHHSDVGGMSPGSMPLANEIFQEGLIIPPVKLYCKGQLNIALWELLLANVRTPTERRGDFLAQINACHIAEKRLQEMVAKYSLETLQTYSTALLDYAEKLLRSRIASLPAGEYSFNDWLDDDGFSPDPIKLQTTVSLQSDGSARIDFSGTSPQVKGSINAVYAVTLSAVVYCFRCLLDGDAPTNAGLMRPLKLVAPEGSIVNACFPAAVSAGNVETSQRLVDVIFGALAKAAPELIPAASSGSMNNLTFGGQFQNRPFSFYETIGGGSGATAESNGTSAVHTHMTNTLNTPIEAIEREFPVRVECYSLCKNSGGDGKYIGGDGIVRRIKFLSQAQVGLISERRKFVPYGLAGGSSGKRGKNSLIREDGQKSDLPGKFNMLLEAGETVEIQTPGGGGWGSKSSQ